jgi:predicted lipoprotein
VHRAVGIVATCAVVAGCGGGSQALSASAYRSKVTAACEAQVRAIDQLPHEQQADDLTVTQLKARVGKIDSQFTSRIAALHPPSSLAAADQQLLALRRTRAPAVSTRAAAIAAAQRARAVYVRIGVPGCVWPLDSSIARLRAGKR